jgi:hypothetical protein
VTYKSSQKTIQHRCLVSNMHVYLDHYNFMFQTLQQKRERFAVPVSKRNEMQPSSYVYHVLLQSMASVSDRTSPLGWNSMAPSLRAVWEPAWCLVTRFRARRSKAKLFLYYHAYSTLIKVNWIINIFTIIINNIAKVIINLITITVIVNTNIIVVTVTITIVLITFNFSSRSKALVDLSLLTIDASRSYSDTPHSVGLLWTRDQPVAETSTWQHTQETGHPCPRRDSKPQSQQASCCRPTP